MKPVYQVWQRRESGRRSASWRSWPGSPGRGSAGALTGPDEQNRLIGCCVGNQGVKFAYFGPSVMDHSPTAGAQDPFPFISETDGESR
jgi:hypothetical protein